MKKPLGAAAQPKPAPAAQPKPAPTAAPKTTVAPPVAKPKPAGVVTSSAKPANSFLKNDSPKEEEKKPAPA